MGILKKEKINKFFSNKTNINLTRLLCYMLIIYILSIQNITMSAGIIIVLLMTVTNYITHIHSMSMGILYMILKKMRSED